MTALGGTHLHCWNLDEERTKKREIRAICSAMKDLDLDRGIIITEDTQAVEETDGKPIYFIPMWKWFLNQKE